MMPPAIQPLKDLFTCPISHDVMEDPVIATCGHTFERGNIEGWRAILVRPGQPFPCPLCRTIITQLLQNLMVRQALEVINRPENQTRASLETLPPEELQAIRTAVLALTERREANAAHNIPHRLATPKSFTRRASTTYSNIFSWGFKCFV